MFDAKKLLDSFLGADGGGGQAGWREKAGQAAQMAKDNPLAAGAIASILLGTGAGRQLTGSALKLGGMAAIAGLAYKAYRDYQSGAKPGAATGSQPDLLPPPESDSFHPSQAPQGEDEFALVLVRAMIAAAKSDGHIDEAERRRIGDKVKLAGIEAEAEQFLAEELKRPVDVEALVKTARTDAQKVELYTASRLAIDPDSRAERGYLDMLAGRLKLPDALVDHIEATVSSATA